LAVAVGIRGGETGREARLMSAGRDKERRICPTCGDVNDCGMEKGEATCWCFALPHVLPVSETEGGSCYCSACLSRMIAELEAREKFDFVNPAIALGEAIT
jgi:hypothetical protein